MRESKSYDAEPAFCVSGVGREYSNHDDDDDDDDIPAMKMSSDMEDDPVTDVLTLAKSISHLSPETQDLIMRQVMAERREKSKMGAVVDSWP